jgi:hypothetical protein
MPKIQFICRPPACDVCLRHLHDDHDDVELRVLRKSRFRETEARKLLKTRFVCNSTLSDNTRSQGVHMTYLYVQRIRN